MSQTENPLQIPRRGWLKNGNPPGDLTKVRRCGARTRRGEPCRGPAMKNGRCRLHGGASTGPRTAEGLECMRHSKIKHGLYTKEMREFRRVTREMMAQAKATLNAWHEEQRRIPGPPLPGTLD